MPDAPSSTTAQHTPPPRVLAWLDWLKAQRIEGIRVGIDHRVEALDAYRRLDEAGLLPADEPGQWAVLAPIVCTHAEAQRRYREAIETFRSQPSPTGEGAKSTGRGGSTPASKPFPWDWTFGFGVFLVLASLVLWMSGRRSSTGITTVVTPSTNRVPILNLAPNATFTYFTNVVDTTNAAPTSVSPTPRWLAFRMGSRLLAAACAVALLLWAWDRLRRRLYLEQGPTLEQIEHRLADPREQPGTAFRSALNGAAAALQRRISGHREILDLAASVVASIRAGGAFVPRHRRIASTPAYLVLLERLHPRDHLAVYFRECLALLARAGVVVDLYVFRGSPAHGCARWDPLCSREPSSRQVSLDALLATFPTHRVLVVAHPETGVHLVTGLARPWVARLAEHPDKGWICPLPRASWSRREATLAAHGFRLLPATPEAFLDLAARFSGREGLPTADADSHRRFPRFLEQDPVGCLARSHPPDRPTLELWIAQLRAYLGETRFQWLCATCIFPALTPSITRSLGAKVDAFASRSMDGPSGAPGKEVPRGRAAPPLGPPRPMSLVQGGLRLATLPFHRHAVVPSWLRRRLVREIRPSSARALRAHLTGHLVRMASGTASEGIPVAQGARFRSLAEMWDWLKSGRGLAGDSILVSFLNPGHLGPLAQRLPEALRQRLFPDGVAAYGLRPWASVALAVLGVAAWAAPIVFPPKPNPEGPSFRLTPTGFVTTPAFTNDLGMVFVPIARAGVWFSAWETRVQDYAEYAASNSAVDGSWRNPVHMGEPVTPGPTHPVVNVSWTDATNFCHWLTLRERQAGRLPVGYRYRLPTDLEWSAAVGLTNETGRTPEERDEMDSEVYPWGTQWPPPNGIGNFVDESYKEGFGEDGNHFVGYRDGFSTTSPVGSLVASALGAHDLSGNVWEWNQDYYSPRHQARVLRGGSWTTNERRFLQSGFRSYEGPTTFAMNRGFRTILTQDEATR